METVKKKVHTLKKGDVLSTSKLKVISVSAGAKTPSGKMDVTVEKPDGTKVTKTWGKNTEVGVVNEERKYIRPIHESISKTSLFEEFTGDERSDHMSSSNDIDWKNKFVEYVHSNGRKMTAGEHITPPEVADFANMFMNKYSIDDPQLRDDVMSYAMDFYKVKFDHGDDDNDDDDYYPSGHPKPICRGCHKKGDDVEMRYDAYNIPTGEWCDACYDSDKYPYKKEKYDYRGAGERLDNDDPGESSRLGDEWDY